MSEIIAFLIFLGVTVIAIFGCAVINNYLVVRAIEALRDMNEPQQKDNRDYG